jgi:hypothetical protein
MAFFICVGAVATARMASGTTGVTTMKIGRRVKVCIEYENGDECCRYKEGR